MNAYRERQLERSMEFCLNAYERGKMGVRAARDRLIELGCPPKETHEFLLEAARIRVSDEKQDASR